MGRTKFVSAEEAVSYIKDGATLAMGGFVGTCLPEELIKALEKRFLDTGAPKNLTLMYAAGNGNAEYGVCHLAHEGLLDKLYCAHVGLTPQLGELSNQNKVKLFMVPQGIIGALCRGIAGHKPGIISNIGVGTYVDPRIEGCKGNQAAIDSGEEVVELFTYGGKEYLFYKTFPVDVCFLKGTYADEDGNISLEEEGVLSDHLEFAAATHNSGGIVIVQVNKVLKNGSIAPKNIAIHNFLVDYVVVGSPENNMQVYDHPAYRLEISGQQRIPLSAIEPLPLNNRKVCARRGAMEITKDVLVNVGVGMGEAVGNVAGEEGLSDKFTFSTEAGPLGGVPLGGAGMGANFNFEAINKQCDIFDIYDGGGLDITFLGAAQFDCKGNVNVSKFSGRMVGPGGFINISQTAKKVCFLGTFTAVGLKEEIGDGKLTIVKEGKIKKFLNEVEQLTFSASSALENGQTVIYITERAVFKLTEKGLVLTEIAPGIDLQKDVLDQMEFTPIIADDLKLMDERIFRPEKMGLTIE